MLRSRHSIGYPTTARHQATWDGKQLSQDSNVMFLSPNPVSMQLPKRPTRSSRPRALIYRGSSAHQRSISQNLLPALCFGPEKAVCEIPATQPTPGAASLVEDDLGELLVVDDAVAVDVGLADHLIDLRVENAGNQQRPAEIGRIDETHTTNLDAKQT